MRIGGVVVLLFAVATSASLGGDSKALKAAFKQVNKAVKPVRGVVADFEFSETIGAQTVRGSGKLYVDFSRMMRVELGGDAPRTVLFAPPFLQIYQEIEGVVEIYDLTSNPNRLGQYLILGFAPAGSAMKQRFDVQLVENGKLDGRPVLSFLLTPSSEEGARAVARIQLWVDPESGLPLKHEMYHRGSDTTLSVRYVKMTRDDELPAALFQPNWPEGTSAVRK